MKLEVTLCYSLLEKCFDSITNVFDETTLLNELKRRKLIIHHELENIYESYFKHDRPELFDIYAAFVSSILNNEMYSKVVDNINESPVVELIFPDSNNNRIVTNVCNSTEDKILMSELLNDFEKEKLENEMSISSFNSTEILDENKPTILNHYKIPIFKRVPQGENSFALSKWLGRFLKNEKEITIIDNFLYENSINFYNYVIKYIDKDANIKLITMVNNRNTEANIINKFKSSPFDLWNISEIHIVNMKREQHARNILTENYIIMIDKGMAVFGTGRVNNTDQSDITINYRSKVQEYSLPLNIRKIV
ncbi:hypothetical protein [Paenibacillus agri]|uniref:Uncharacterized protein n=1 Tax=Paenibacillus agri TaxID=2744309 RepID=A0A850ENZ2_9BACL|nr:hypothetical protein [Paenibacillus agri]NUU61257.1 hypothetical protein [Paenibacillus agri]